MTEQTYTGTTRKRGYYSSALSGELLEEYEMALGMEGLDNEIALLRGLIKIWIMNSVVYPNFIGRLFDTLDRLCKTNKKLFKKDDNNMEDVVENVFTKLATKAGVPLEVQMMNPLKNLSPAS